MSLKKFTKIQTDGKGVCSTNELEDHCSSLVFISTEINTINILVKVQRERGGSVVMHETRIREVPGSNPVAGQTG